MSAFTIPQGVEIKGNLSPGHKEVLSCEALQLVADLHRSFEAKRRELMLHRVARAKAFDEGQTPDFLPETASIRNSEWTIAPLPADLQDRRVEITGPVERKMVINALNSGAYSFMSDFEDSNTPTWENQLEGQINLRDAIRRTIEYTNSAGKQYRLNEKTAVLLVRPRGWHLDEKHVLVDGQRVSAGMFDFAVYMFHNAKELLARGSGPYFYLPKMESHLEARLWNDIFVFTQNALGIPQGTIKATVLVETILAAFEMDEILYELREHSAGLNAGRWDYIFSCIKKFKLNKDFCLADRGQITMTVPFMRAYGLLLLKTCHRRNAPAIGGMAAQIPIKDNAAANEAALAKVRADKDRDATDGYDGGWVAHPGLVPIALAAWNAVMPTPNQIFKQRPDVSATAADLLNFQPEKPITEGGLRNNISVGIQYLGSWLGGNGCVAIFNLMEDAATAEIARSQVWQWIRSPKGILEDGRKVTSDLVREWATEELEKVRVSGVVEATAFEKTYRRAAEIFINMSTSETFTEFLTTPLYEEL